jgi:hypothetical protein
VRGERRSESPRGLTALWPRNPPIAPHRCAVIIWLWAGCWRPRLMRCREGRVFAVRHKNQDHANWSDDRPLVTSPDSLTAVDAEPAQLALGGGFSLGHGTSGICGIGHQVHCTPEGDKVTPLARSGSDPDVVEIEKGAREFGL